jgi:hypothetical protein
MSEYGFGGSEEENAELNKLNAEVVRSSVKHGDRYYTDMFRTRLQIPITLRTGRSSCVVQRGLKVASIATQIPEPLRHVDTSTIDSLQSFHYYSATGRNTQTSSSQ